MIQFMISFLVLLNPFALFIYLNPIAKDLNRRDYLMVLAKAGGLSLLIFLGFALFGRVIFEKILLIDFSSFKIFGGVVITAYALIFIIQGKKSFFTLKGSLDDLAAEIALPFMVGAATISLCIIIGNKFHPFVASGIITITMVIHISLVFFLTILKYSLFKERLKVAFDKTMGMFLRLNGFIVGAIGSNLIISGIREFFSISV
jgi:multiple antibiotic resistance protein